MANNLHWMARKHNYSIIKTLSLVSREFGKTQTAIRPKLLLLKQSSCITRTLIKPSLKPAVTGFAFGKRLTSYLPKYRPVLCNSSNKTWALHQKVAKVFVSCHNRRCFHTTDCRNAAPILPVIGAMLARFSGPIARSLKLLAVILGRTFRKWWKKLPEHRKEKLKKQLTSRKEIIAGILATIIAGWLFLYYIHLEEAPYTKRLRYLGVTPHQIQDMAETQWRQLLEAFADDIIPVSHPDHQRVFRIVEKLIRANIDEKMDGIEWQVNVISSEENNAFVLPNGQIFVFTGLLTFLPNDDSLAIILGHEIAHAILQHSAEQLCFHGFVNVIKVVLLATIWALLPHDALAFITQSIQNAILGLFWHLPYSRTLEEEADKVGMYFAAKACFDVREGPKVWQSFGDLEQAEEIESVEWLSTHPSHENRERSLQDLLPEVLALRKLCNCPELLGVSSTEVSSKQKLKAKPLTLSSMAGVNMS